MKDSEQFCNHEGLANGVHIIHSPYCNEGTSTDVSMTHPSHELRVGEHITEQPQQETVPSAGT